jgi:hypothetical protein
MNIAKEVPARSPLNRWRIVIAIRLAAVLVIAGALAGQSAAQSIQQLHSFTGGNDGYQPQSTVVADKNGVLYGTAFLGGFLNCNGGSGLGCGTVYQLTPPAGPTGSWTFSLIYKFMGEKDGCCQYSTLAIDDAGNLYGVTNFGVGEFYGGVFRLSPPVAPSHAWKFSILYEFQNQADGQNPQSPLAIDKAGAVYGVTRDGSLPGCGGNGCGAVFQLVPPQRPSGPWKENTLYQFQGLRDGGTPTGLLIDKDGTLFGTTSAGGTVGADCPNGCGVVFEMYTFGNGFYEMPIYTFQDSPDGAIPYSLTMDRSGTLYGLAGFYTKQNLVSVFRLKPPAKMFGRWQKGVLYAFPSRANGGYPPTYLTTADDNNLYGAVFGDIDLDSGYIFQLTPPDQNGGGWTYRTVLDMNASAPDRNPNGVIRAKFGHLYGTLNGGDSDGGDVFEIF